MSDLGRSLAAFALPLAVGRAVDLLLGTRWGREMAEATGNPSLATAEGRHLVRKYSAAAAAVSLGAAFTVGRVAGMRRAQTDRLETHHSLSALFLATGALLKVAVDYLHDRRKMEREVVRRA